MWAEKQFGNSINNHDTRGQDSTIELARPRLYSAGDPLPITVFSPVFLARYQDLAQDQLSVGRAFSSQETDENVASRLFLPLFFEQRTI